MQYIYSDALACYDSLLEAGVCEEQARLVLPLGVNTEFIWSGSLAVIEMLKLNVGRNDIVYVKGSRGMRMEDVVTALTGR